MARIKSKDTKPELIVRHYLYHRGYRYRKNVKDLPGTPDIVLYKYNIVIFVHGCFWHGHEIDSHIPHSNKSFWEKKITQNKIRDQRNKIKLKRIRLACNDNLGMSVKTSRKGTNFIGNRILHKSYFFGKVQNSCIYTRKLLQPSS